MADNGGSVLTGGTGTAGVPGFAGGERLFLA